MSIQCLDLNPQPSVYESPPITTRPNLHAVDIKKYSLLGPV